MYSLANDLSRQIKEQVENAHRCLAAAETRIKQAETLAEKLNSKGVYAHAHGQAINSQIMVWVTAGPVEAPRLDTALACLDLVELDRMPCHFDYEIRLQGYDIPLYVLPPTSEIP